LLTSPSFINIVFSVGFQKLAIIHYRCNKSRFYWNPKTSSDRWTCARSTILLSADLTVIELIIDSRKSVYTFRSIKTPGLIFIGPETRASIYQSNIFISRRYHQKNAGKSNYERKCQIQSRGTRVKMR